MSGNQAKLHSQQGKTEGFGPDIPECEQSPGPQLKGL